MGSAGEALGVWFLTEHGMRVLAANIRVGRGEIDLLAMDGECRVAVEVRTSTGRDDPIDAIGEPKRKRVDRLGALLGADRVDLIGIGLEARGMRVHWLPGPG